MNRRKAVAGALLVQAGLGSIISWVMLFTSAHGRAGAILSPAFSSEWIFTAGLLAFAAAVLSSGPCCEKIGPRKIAAASGILLGAGYCSTLLLDISSLEEACLITGVFGAAAGLVYIVSIDTGMKWYPEKKGIVTGLILAGSGFGGLCWFRVQEILVTMVSLQDTLLAIGCVSAMLVLAGACTISEPPAGYVPPVWKKPENPLADLPGPPAELREILGRPAFFIIAGSMLLISSAAVFFSGNLQYAGNKILVARGLEVQLAARITLLATAILAISDGLGRIAWGSIADSIGSKLTVVILCAVETVMIILISRMGGDGSILIFGTFVIGTALGGLLTVFPCIVREYVGEQEFVKSYSIIFASFLFIAAGTIQASGLLRESFGTNTAMWLNCLFVSGALPLAGGAVMMLLKRPGRRGMVREDENLQKDFEPDELRPGDPPEHQPDGPPAAGPSEGGAPDAGLDSTTEEHREKDEAIQQNN